MIAVQGADPGFQIDGAQKIVHQVHISSANSRTAGVKSRLMALEALPFEMLSHAFWALIWSILIWLEKKPRSRSKFRGGARLLRPPLDPPLQLSCDFSLISQHYKFLKTCPSWSRISHTAQVISNDEEECIEITVGNWQISNAIILKSFLVRQLQIWQIVWLLTIYEKLLELKIWFVKGDVTEEEYQWMKKSIQRNLR